MKAQEIIQKFNNEEINKFLMELNPKGYFLENNSFSGNVLAECTGERSKYSIETTFTLRLRNKTLSNQIKYLVLKKLTNKEWSADTWWKTLKGKVEKFAEIIDSSGDDLLSNHNFVKLLNKIKNTRRKKLYLGFLNDFMCYFTDYLTENYYEDTIVEFILETGIITTSKNITTQQTILYDTKPSRLRNILSVLNYVYKQSKRLGGDKANRRRIDSNQLIKGVKYYEGSVDNLIDFTNKRYRKMSEEIMKLDEMSQILYDDGSDNQIQEDEVAIDVVVETKQSDTTEDVAMNVLQQVIIEKDENIEELKTKLQNVDMTIEEYVDVIAELKQEIVSNDNTIEGLRMNVTELKKELSVKASSINILEDKIRMQESNQEGFDLPFGKLDKQVSKIEERIDNLTYRYESLESSRQVEEELFRQNNLLIEERDKVVEENRRLKELLKLYL